MVLMAFISVQVGLVNLLPVLPLDGRQLVVIAVEKLRGRPLAQRTHRRLALWGAALIGAALAAALYEELVRSVGALLARPTG